MKFILDREKLKEREEELVYFNGFIPIQFLGIIPTLKRNKYLESIGKYDEIEEQNILIRQRMKEAPDSEVYLENVLKEWLIANPKFKNLFIIDD